MSTNYLLFKDPTQAAQILAALVEKDKDENTCRYPTCQSLRQNAVLTGRPSVYCEDTEHNAVNNHRARQQLKAAVAGIAPEATSKREVSPALVTIPVESLRSSVLSRIGLLQSDLERYVSVLAEISDPDVSAAQIKAALDQANARVAEAQQIVSTEQALRLAAETALLAVQKEARSEREAAELAIQRMEKAETNAQDQIEETERRIRDIQTERDTSVELEHTKALQRIQEIEQQTSSVIAQAKGETTSAQEDARLAKVDALEARAQAATAERLVNEAHISLQRERAEIDRLRKELANTVEDARRRTEADRAEAQTVLMRERDEIDRLRDELIATRKQVEQATLRADKLATANDDLRGQLIQNQTKQKDLQ